MIPEPRCPDNAHCIYDNSGEVVLFATSEEIERYMALNIIVRNEDGKYVAARPE